MLKQRPSLDLDSKKRIEKPLLVLHKVGDFVQLQSLHEWWA